MIAIGSYHGGYERKSKIIDYFDNLDFKDYGTFSKDAVDYPDIAIKVAEDVAQGVCEKGILICRSGVGMDIMANKVKGVRCALCFNKKVAEMSKKHEDVNIISIGADYVSEEETIEIIKNWLDNDFEGGRHQARIDKIRLYEER